jgi:hypothetical protein
MFLPMYAATSRFANRRLRGGGIATIGTPTLSGWGDAGSHSRKDRGKLFGAGVYARFSEAS